MKEESREEKYEKILSFKDMKGLRPIEKVRDRYKLSKLLGKGQYGSVRQGQHRASGVNCAIKMIEKKKIVSESD